MPKVKNEIDQYVIELLRKVTITVKVFPFFYAVIYIFSMFAYLVLRENGCIIIDTLFYASALTVALLVRLSYCVKLCFWHRLQCCLPLLPQPIIFIDNYIYRFGQAIAVINVSLAIVIFILSLINAFFVFAKPAFKEWRRKRYRHASYPRL